MRTILTPGQMRALERRAFELGVPPLLLMENAARAAHALFAELLGGVAGKKVLYLIGSGNNGGDGLAMARLCLLDGGEPAVLLVSKPRTPDAQANLGYVNALGIPVRAWAPGKPVLSEPRPDAVVEAVYGTGFHGALPDAEAMLAREVSASGVTVFAVDAPSGMDSLTGAVAGEAIGAAHTIALGCLKTGLCLTDRPELRGALHAVDIGVPTAAWDALGKETLLTALEPADLSERLPRRPAHAHKGDSGRVLMYMGSLGLAGAAGMAAQAALACLRAGAGLVTVACEEELIPILQALAPNAMCVPIGQAVSRPPRYDVFAIGCGLGQSEAVWNNIQALWRPELPSVWDADALNLLAKTPVALGARALMTPHPGEAARLLGKSVTDVTVSPLRAAEELARKYDCAVVLKGAVSVILGSGVSALNLEGSPALAKGGSGDALTGVIAALMAQQRESAPAEAARAACLWFGMAGKEAERRLGVLSPLTGDVIDCLSAVALRAEGA